MNMTFDEEQLKLDIALLKSKGVQADAAENLAKFKQAVEFAAYFEDSFGGFDKDELPEDVFDVAIGASYTAETAWEEISPIFEQ